jgi:hypothetical protein
MSSELKCNCCHRENLRCTVFVNAKAELTTICGMCLSQALRAALKDIPTKE